MPSLGNWQSDIFQVGAAQAVLVAFSGPSVAGPTIFEVAWGDTPVGAFLSTENFYYMNNDSINHFDVLTPVAPYFQLALINNQALQLNCHVSCTLLPYVAGSLMPQGDRVMAQGHLTATTGTFFTEQLTWQRPGPAILNVFSAGGPACAELNEYQPTSGLYVCVGSVSVNNGAKSAQSAMVCVPNNTCQVVLSQTSGGSVFFDYALTAL